MKKILLLVLLCASFASVQAYKFDTKMEAKVIDMPSKFYDQKVRGEMVLEITNVFDKKEDQEAFPVGTKILLGINSSHGAQYYENPKLYTSVNRVILPDGSYAKDVYSEVEIKPISGIKSSWIPFYRLMYIFGSKSARTVKEGSILTIKPSSSKNVIAVLRP